MSHESFVRKKVRAKAMTIPAGSASNSFIQKSTLASVLLIGLFFVLATLTGAFAQTEKSKLVVLGDSLVAGYGLQPGESFPEQLQKALDEKDVAIEIENAGVSGDTSTGGLARLDWSIGEGTDWVLVELGANDALRGISPDVTKANLDAIITRLKERDIKVMLAGMLAPPNMGADYEAQFNPIYKELAEMHDVPLYPFFLEGVAADPELNQADGIHPTAEGIAVIIENFLPFFNEHFPAS